MGINNPLPASLENECKKAGRILASFIDPKQAFGPDKIIPPSVLASAKGLAVITVLKAGFLFSGRVGSGLVIARLPDGNWSAPSAIATAGAGFGGQIGAELTDFVMILNDASAVKTFSSAGSVTLGGNVSIAAGPVGRNAEASGAASLKGIAGIFSYSKTKGLFAGVSLEGSVIIERKDANKKLYHADVKAQQLLSGSIPPPPEADTLMRVLNSRVFRTNEFGDDMYNDVPIYDDQHDDNIWQGSRGHAMGEDPHDASRRPQRSSTWQDDVYDRNLYNENPTRRTMHFETQEMDSHPNPSRPMSEKPQFGAPKRSSTMPPGAPLRGDQAVALFTFDADQPGDLGFKKGDVITITKKSDSKNDWWTGQIGGRTGIFPSNYVETV